MLNTRRVQFPVFPRSVSIQVCGYDRVKPVQSVRGTVLSPCTHEVAFDSWSCLGTWSLAAPFRPAGDIFLMHGHWKAISLSFYLYMRCFVGRGHSRVTLGIRRNQVTANMTKYVPKETSVTSSSSFVNALHFILVKIAAVFAFLRYTHVHKLCMYIFPSQSDIPKSFLPSSSSCFHNIQLINILALLMIWDKTCFCVLKQFLLLWSGGKLNKFSHMWGWWFPSNKFTVFYYLRFLLRHFAEKIRRCEIAFVML